MRARETKQSHTAIRQKSDLVSCSTLNCILSEVNKKYPVPVLSFAWPYTTIREGRDSVVQGAM